MALDKNNYREANLGSKGQGQDHWERKCKKRFRAYIRQKLMDLHQIKTKMINGLFYTYRRIDFISENALFLAEPTVLTVALLVQCCVCLSSFVVCL